MILDNFIFAFVQLFFDSNGIYDLGPQTTNNVILARAFCSDNSVIQPACASLYFLLAGSDPKQLNSVSYRH